MRLSGKLSGGHYTIPGNISSQYITGLLFALPLVNEDSVLEITQAIESGPYIDLTRDCLERSGIDIGRETDRRYVIKGRQSYDLSGDYDIEGDWSNGAFFICASAMSGGDLKVSNLREDSLQGDRKVLDVLRDLGFEIRRENGSISIGRGELRGITIDAREIPDIIPPLAAVACMVKGTTRIINAGRLVIKESNRLLAIYEILKELGADIELGEDSLTINGKGHLKGGTVDSYNDHRMVMMASICSLISDGDITINGAEAVNKSYPGFFEDLMSLGGKVEYL